MDESIYKHSQYQDDPPPLYGNHQPNRGAAMAPGAPVTEDGRVNIDLNSRVSRTLSRIIRPPSSHDTPATPAQNRYTSPEQFPLRLNIVIQAVGSRGDIQPFVALGNALQRYGHRVRVATHVSFDEFVQDAGLEFFSIGGDPEDLMSYMVRNPGLLPSIDTLRSGDILRKRRMISQLLRGCWDSCVTPDARSGRPFVADAIIANPPSFAHIHCAEALGIPLHLMFTMPWTATSAYPHPLANLSKGPKYYKHANYLSYQLVESMTWQGVGDLINSWRKEIGLEPVPSTEGPMLASTLRVPFTYCWSSALMAKPTDWPEHIDISGFFFRSPPEYSPPEDLQAFLDGGPPPVYIGFGSIVLNDATEMSRLILEAIDMCRYRAIISRGWSRLDGPERKDVYWLEDCPHEWLFQHVSAVVHHGGAGTTACGLRYARPTTVVPFFGDQPFWGNLVASIGVGPSPIPHRVLTADNLAAALRSCHAEHMRIAALSVAERMRQEDGTGAAILSFLNNLPTETMKCDILPEQPASWLLKVKGRRLKVSRVAAEILLKEGANPKKFHVHHTKPVVIENRRWEPTTGLLSSTIGVGTDLITDVGGIVLDPVAEYRKGSARTVKDSSDPDSDMKYNNTSVAGPMALASAKSAGRIIPTFFRGAFVEMPLAVTEGFRNIPRLWGGTPASYGQVTDWKSGGAVAAKSFALGITHGARDLATLPSEGAKKEGLIGGVKGVAKSGGSLVAQTLSGTVGLVAYTGQGLAKSIFAKSHGEARRQILEARRADGIETVRVASVEVVEEVQRSYRRLLCGVEQG